MRKLLGIVVLSFLCSNLGFAYEKYKPLSKINLKLWGSIEDLYQSIPNINKAECEIRFFYNGSYMRETLNSTISESDFFLVANFKNNEANKLDIGKNQITARFADYELGFQMILLDGDTKPSMTLSKYDYKNDRFLEHYKCDVETTNIE